MMVQSWRRCLIPLLLLGLAVGCGRHEKLGTVPASGTVKFKGQPVEGATVTLSPKNPSLRAAVGKTDASGRFQLMTSQPGDGAMPGSYAVAVSKSESEAAPAAASSGTVAPTDFSNTSALDAQYKARDEAAKKGGGAAQPKDFLPAKYKTAGTSGLTAEIKPSGANDLTLDLTE